MDCYKNVGKCSKKTLQTCLEVLIEDNVFMNFVKVGGLKKVLIQLLLRLFQKKIGVLGARDFHSIRLVSRKYKFLSISFGK